MASVWGNVSDWRAPVWKICKKSDGVLHSFWKFRNFPPPYLIPAGLFPYPPPVILAPPRGICSPPPPPTRHPPHPATSSPIVTVYYCCTRLRYCCIRCGHGIRGRMRARAVGMAGGATQHRGKPPSHSHVLTTMTSHPLTPKPLTSH